MRYRKKPIEVEASQVNPSTIGAIGKWCGGRVCTGSIDFIEVPAGGKHSYAAFHGDWVARNDEGLFSVWKDDSFRRVWEIVDE